MSGSSYDRAKAVVKAAEEDPGNETIQEALKKMDDTGTGGHNRVRVELSREPAPVRA